MAQLVECPPSTQDVAGSNPDTCIHVHVHIHMYMYMYIYTCTCTCTCMCSYIIAIVETLLFMLGEGVCSVSTSVGIV